MYCQAKVIRFGWANQQLFIGTSTGLNNVRLLKKCHFRGLVHNWQVAVQVHRTPSTATGSVSFLIAEDYFSGEPQAAAKQGFLCGAIHHTPSVSHSGWSLRLCRFTCLCHRLGKEVREMNRVRNNLGGGRLFLSNLVAWAAVYVKQSRLERGGVGGCEKGWWENPASTSPRGMAGLHWAVGFCKRFASVRVDFWCVVSFFSWGNTETHANCKGKCVEKPTTPGNWWNCKAGGAFPPCGLSRFLGLKSACDPETEPTTVLLRRASWCEQP